MSDLNYNTIELAKVDREPTVQLVRSEYYSRFPDTASKFTDNDWGRTNHVFKNLIRGGAMLEVGVGQGPFINCVSQAELFESLTGIDIRSYSMFFKIKENYDVQMMDATAMSFPDRSFDVVTCMEVLEHLEEEGFQRALAELRRVCRHQLLVTVPFREPLPLPKYHKLRFDEGDLQRCFPHGRYTLMRKDNPRKVHWMLVEERFDAQGQPLRNWDSGQAAKPAGWLSRLSGLLGKGA